MTSFLDTLEASAKAAPEGPYVLYSGRLRAAFPTQINEIQREEDRKPLIAWSGFDASVLSEKKRRALAKHITLCSPDNILALVRVARASFAVHEARMNGTLHDGCEQWIELQHAHHALDALPQ